MLVVVTVNGWARKKHGNVQALGRSVQPKLLTQTIHCWKRERLMETQTMGTHMPLAEAKWAQWDPSLTLTLAARSHPYPSSAFQPTKLLRRPEESASDAGGMVSASVDLGQRRLQLDRVDRPNPDAPLRTYHCQLPGPTLYVMPGDRIRITLCNTHPPQNDRARPELPSPPGTGSTHLDFHGLHVPPEQILKQTGIDPNGQPMYYPILPSDDLFAQIAPGQTCHCWVSLPPWHVPGTYWYQAHQQASGTIHATNGVVGAIVIPEPPEHAMGIADANDVVWLVHELVGQDQDLDRHRPNRLGIKGGTRGRFLVNGKYQPTLTVPSQQLQRWRFINATGTPRGMMSLHLRRCSEVEGSDPATLTPHGYPDSQPASGQRSGDARSGGPQLSDPGVEMHLIAQDGLSFYNHPPRTVTCWPFAPSNRSDFLVKLPAGQYQLIKGPYRYPHAAEVPPTPPRPLEVLAHINVQGPDPEDPDPEDPDVGGTLPARIPGTWPDYLHPIMDADILFRSCATSFALLKFCHCA